MVALTVFDRFINTGVTLPPLVIKRKNKTMKPITRNMWDIQAEKMGSCEYSSHSKMTKLPFWSQHLLILVV